MFISVEHFRKSTKQFLDFTMVQQEDSVLSHQFYFLLTSLCSLLSLFFSKMIQWGGYIISIFPERIFPVVVISYAVNYLNTYLKDLFCN